MKALAVVAVLIALPACGADPGTSSATPANTNRPDPSWREQGSRSDSSSSSAHDPGGRSSHADKGGKR